MDLNRIDGSLIINNIEDMKAACEKNKANLYRADLTGANLTWANIGVADLRLANMGRANLSKANLGRANLGMANLTGADLYMANLIRANLTGANLGGANLGGANLYMANLTGANLGRANLTGVNLFDNIEINGDCKIYQFIGLKYHVILFCDSEKKILEIGCHIDLLENWKKYTHEDIDNIKTGNIEIWDKWENVVFQWCNSIGEANEKR